VAQTATSKIQVKSRQNTGWWCLTAIGAVRPRRCNPAATLTRTRSP